MVDAVDGEVVECYVECVFPAVLLVGDVLYPLTGVSGLEGIGTDTMPTFRRALPVARFLPSPMKVMTQNLVLLSQVLHWDIRLHIGRLSLCRNTIDLLP